MQSLVILSYCKSHRRNRVCKPRLRQGHEPGYECPERKLGVYHYAREEGCKGSAVAEADFRVKTVQEYIGKAILVLGLGGRALPCRRCLGKRIFDGYIRKRA